MILKCNCEHAAQDRFHGDGRRVHNPIKDPSGGTRWRCTVCKTERSDPNKK